MKNETIGDLIPMRFHPILDVLMPGGENWRLHRELADSVDEYPCLSSCPFYEKCDKKGGLGPDKTLCNQNWHETRITRTSLAVLDHILMNYDYYNAGDYKFYGEYRDIISDLQRIFLASAVKCLAKEN